MHVSMNTRAVLKHPKFNFILKSILLVNIFLFLGNIDNRLGPKNDTF